MDHLRTSGGNLRKSDQNVDQIFGQGFDHGLGEGKTIHTLYSTTRPQENRLETITDAQHL